MSRFQFRLLVIVVLFIFGCSSQYAPSQLFKPKKPKDLDVREREAKDKFFVEGEEGRAKLVGDYAVIGNNIPMEVIGSGLVTGLPGTGSNDVNSYEWHAIFNKMKKEGKRDARAILADPTTTVVRVQGYVLAGAQVGDLFDVKVIVPEGSETISLRGGWLMDTELVEMRVFDTNNGGVAGHAFAKVAGPILVDPLATETNNPSNLKMGRVLGGARVAKPRGLILHLKPEEQSAFIAGRIAQAINKRFFLTTGQTKGVATAKSDQIVFLEVHPTYHNDIPRYIQVVSAISGYETTALRPRRIEHLSKELRDPRKAQKASFQLEAIGKDAIPALRSVLNDPSPEIRFYAATALAYLGDSSVAKILADLAKNESAFRVYVLQALSVLKNDIEAELALQELLHVPSVETRYGAFQALWLRNPYDRIIRGEILGSADGHSFSYHGIASNGPPMIHVRYSKRPEIVVFGQNTPLRTPFQLDAGPYISVIGKMNGEVVVTRYTTGGGPDEKRTVPNSLDAIIRAVVELRGTYPDVMQMFCMADSQKVLPYRLEIDKLPETHRVYTRPRTDEDDFIERNAASQKKPTVWEKINPAKLFAPNPGGTSTDYEGDMNFGPREDF